MSHEISVSRDSSVGTGTRYRLDGPGIESRWGARFSAPVQTGPGAHPASCKVRPGRDADFSSPPSAEVKNRVQLHLYSP